MIDDLDADERAALDAWTVDEPPRELASRIITIDEARARSRKMKSAIGALAITAIAASIAAATTYFARGPVHGEHRAMSARAELSLGDRAIAVAEAGTELEWSIARSGSAEVEQRSGNTFYRVEHGGPFVVHTPQGDVTVLGTCFRVEVLEMKAASSGLIGAGLGAAIAATVVVTVYEGKVVTASPHGDQKVAIAAGESAELDDHGAHAAVEKVKKVARADSLPALPDLPANATQAQILEAHAQLKKEAEKMREELNTLRKEAAEKDRMSKRRKTFDIEQPELERMVKDCEIAWDMQGLGPKPQIIKPENLDKLKISEDEHEVIDRVFKEDHERVVKALTAIYIEATGDPNPGALAPQAMLAELNDKAPKGELSRVFQLIARERAGMQPPPADISATTPWERLYRMLHASGDALEASFVKELGTDTARALRDLNDGWGWQSRQSVGCPEGQ